MFLARFSKRLSRRQRRVVIALSIALPLLVAALAWRFNVHRHAHAISNIPKAALAPMPPAARPTREVTFSEGCMTAECHTTHLNAPMAHRSVQQGSCHECHLPDAGGHVFPLVGSKSDLCGKCHEIGADHPVQHKAMTDDGCLACHGPHGGSTFALLINATSKQTCANCHTPATGPVPHEPYANDRCEVCHDVHGSSTRQLLIAGSADESCRPCHAPVVQKFESAMYSHRSVLGGCVGCHSPHAAEVKGLLSAPVKDSCMACHAEIREMVVDATFSHESVLHTESCTRCHDPHASDDPAMLREPETTLCLSCHSHEITATNGRKIEAKPDLHGMSENVRGHRECASCHSVHGGTHMQLTPELVTKVPLHREDQRNYALCFTCHDARLVRDAGATNFRNDTLNLHAAHMASSARNRGCGACHDVHALGEVRLMAKSVKFEGTTWEAPMGFELTQDGGRCGPGCHEAMDYSRSPGGVKAKKGMGAP